MYASTSVSPEWHSRRSLATVIFLVGAAVFLSAPLTKDLRALVHLRSPGTAKSEIPGLRSQSASPTSSLGPSLVSINGRQVIVRKRNPDGTLGAAVPYIIRGVDWSPASQGTNTSKDDPNNVAVRRAEFSTWGATDIPLIKTMNVNTVYIYMDPGLDAQGIAVLDHLYSSGIMVVMTVDDGINNLSRVQQAVNFYKDHPAVLAWMLGNEWNINRYFTNPQISAAEAAQRTETAAALIKSLDSNHPVATSYGEIDIPTFGMTLADTHNYVNNVCHSVDLWGLNIFRGNTFGTLFEQWKVLSDKPMFLGEFGTDAFRSIVPGNPITGSIDGIGQAHWDLSEWNHLVRNLSAQDPAKVAVGGFVFSWADEWWKVQPAGSQQTSGFSLSGGHPDGFASEEVFGLVDINRNTRASYHALKVAFDPAYQPSQAVTFRAASRGYPAAEYPFQNGVALFFKDGRILYRAEGGGSGGRGFNVAAIDPCTNDLRSPVQHFDSWATRDSGTALNQMMAFLDSLPNGTLILIAVADEAGLNEFPSQGCQHHGNPYLELFYQKLEALGSNQIRNYCYGNSWAMVTVKGESQARAEQLTSTSEASASGTQPVAAVLSPRSQTFLAGGGSDTVNVSAAAGCGWTAVSNEGFITVVAPGSGTGNGLVNYSVAAITSTTSRVGTLTIAGQPFVVSQSTATSTPTPTPTPTPTSTPTPTPTPTMTNFALVSNGATASASSTLDSGRAPVAANNGDRKGIHWGTDPSTGSGWHDATSNNFPDWLQIEFNGTKSLSEIDVFTIQDNYSNPATPTDTMTFGLYGITAFELQYWNGSSWLSVPGGSVSGNNKVWRRFILGSPIQTSKIRVLINSGLAGYSRIVEVEAWGTGSGDCQALPNVALTANGGVAIASSALDAGRGATAVNNGDRKGLHWGTDPATGSGWHDATANSYPDWVQISFSGLKNIGEVDVFTIQDTFTSPLEPTDTLTFSQYGVTTFQVEYWNGAAWVLAPGGSVSNNNLVKRKFSFSPVSTTAIRVVVNNALAGYSRITEVEAYEGSNSDMSVNYALISNGGVASASSTLDSGRAPNAANNGDRKGVHWGTDPATGSGWHDGTSNNYPDWLQVDFDGPRSIHQINVFTIQDVFSNPAEPTRDMTFTQYGITAFETQYWNGAGWMSVPGGAVSGNNRVWRQFAFAPIQTSKIRILTNNALSDHSRITEVEAWGTESGSCGRPNVALASQGGVASASSILDAGRSADAANNGDRAGIHWGTDPATGSGWHDATTGSYPDWLQIDFNSSKTINEIDVFTVQDQYANPVDPADTMTFSLYGITAFEVQYWDGTSWVTVSGGSGTGNNLVKRRFTFPPITTSKIRVVINNALGGYSRITEVEAYEAP